MVHEPELQFQQSEGTSILGCYKRLHCSARLISQSQLYSTNRPRGNILEFRLATP